MKSGLENILEEVRMKKLRKNDEALDGQHPILFINIS